MYLYRISTKQTNVWSRKEPKPVYFVAQSKEAALEWANRNLQEGLSVSKISRLAEQVGGGVFVGI